MAYASELSLSSNGVIVDYYNKRNNRVLKADAVKVSIATDAVGMPDGDTTVTMVGLIPTDINGVTRVYYDRLDLTEYLEDDILLIETGEFNSISDILQAIGHLHGINISAKEIYPKRIPKQFKKGDEVLELTINMRNSALYKGSFKVKVNYETLAKRIPILILDGFTCPVKEM